MHINLLGKIGILLAFSVVLVACNEQGNEGAKSENKSTSVATEATALEKTTAIDNHLTASAQQGKQAFAACNACHNPELDPPLAPPMYGVKNHYTRAYPEKEAFVQAIVSFVQKPTTEKALMQRPVAELGLMPANSVSLPEQDLINVATYIFEENFALPCKHWEIAVRNAEAKGEVDAHIEKDKMKLQRFCAE